MFMMKRVFIAFCLFAGVYLNKVKADEGMWLPMFIDRLNYIDMQKMGLHLTAEEIYSVNHSSLKDAIIQFAGGCTAEIISTEGLLITNHHCGFGAIQANSSVEHDYLTNGYWALKKSDELKCDGLTARFLIRIENVTDRVLNQLKDTMSEASRNRKIKDISKQIEDEASKDTHYEANVKSFFNGNEFYLFVTETFRDVRLVGTPPQSLGKFGGDTDNWMWPRHTCDFSMFRIYTGTDGKPADYSVNNIPMKPKHSLPISLNGVKNGDFTMIMGYPGSTDRFLTSYGVKIAIEKYNPSIVKIREKKLAIMKEDMNASEAVRIQYAAKYAGTANYWKYFIGQTKGLKRLDVYDRKLEIEKEFTGWLNQNGARRIQYGEALKNISKAYAELEKATVARVYFSEALTRGAEIIPFSRNFEELAKLLKADKQDKEKISSTIASLKETSDKYFKDYNMETDKKLLAAMLTIYCNNIPKEQQPQVIIDIADKFNKDFSKYADKVFESSIFISNKKVAEFLNNPKSKTLEKDIMFETMKAIYAYSKDFNQKFESSYSLLDKGNRLFVKGLREMNPDKKYYPNANSTMRLSYGKIMSYDPADAVKYDYFTTLNGVMEKEDPNNDEFNVPDKINQLFANKDYGRYAENGKLVTCFITNNDITGGNSGSPVLNADGELLGLAFDSNWEGVSGNIAYEPNMQRTICVDIRYVLFVIDKFAGAGSLLSEMKISDKAKSHPPMIMIDRDINTTSEPKPGQGLRRSDSPPGNNLKDPNDKRVTQPIQNKINR